MHYKIGSEIIIRTENAAKPASQASSYLKGLLRRLPPVETSFDYGCGKLRYCEVLLKRTDTLAIVDSEIQLSRLQTIAGTKTTIRDAIGGSNRIHAYNDQEFKKLHERFDRGFCVNVLSVIPDYSVRRNVLDTIHSKLKVGGTCLFVTQYRNSDFNRMRQLSNAKAYRDGFLIDSLRGFSFYALITPDRLNSMISKAGFCIQQSHINEGSAYTVAARS